MKILWFYRTGEIDPDNPAHEQYIANIVIELINVLEAKVRNAQFFIKFMKTAETA